VIATALGVFTFASLTLAVSVIDVDGKPEIERDLMGEIPINRWGKLEEIAGLAVYLASDEAGYVTGSTYLIDGGTLRLAGSS
jgi:NAD(P)-dependent dehydrogenase (short-subunit alcohol dehydrogenase family)